jgi:hypothetical protein
MYVKNEFYRGKKWYEGLRDRDMAEVRWYKYECKTTHNDSCPHSTRYSYERGLSPSIWCLIRIASTTRAKAGRSSGLTLRCPVWCGLIKASVGKTPLHETQEETKRGCALCVKFDKETEDTNRVKARQRQDLITLITITFWGRGHERKTWEQRTGQ